jgi:hypothetical protein
LLLCSITVTAYDFRVDGIYYNILSQDDKTVEVCSRGVYLHNAPDEYSGSVVISETVEYNSSNYKVIPIGGSAFEHCNGLTSVYIPNSVTSIGKRAFLGSFQL